MLARSSPNRPGTTRRAGRTIQSASAETNCPTGLRNGARNHCMWKRKSSAYTKKPNAVWISRWAIWLNIAFPVSFLAQFLAQLLAALAGGMDRADDRVLHLVLGHACERPLGRAALGGHPFAQYGHRIGTARSEPGRAGEGVQHELVRDLHRESQLPRCVLDRLDEVEDVRRAASGDRPHRVLGFVEAGDPILVDELAARLGADLDHAYVLQREVLAQQSADERVGHVAATDERDSHDRLSLAFLQISPCPPVPGSRLRRSPPRGPPTCPSRVYPSQSRRGSAGRAARAVARIAGAAVPRRVSARAPP